MSVDQKITIAVDAMGGDNAPQAVIDGISIALARHPEVRFLLFGDETRLTGLVAEKPQLAQATVIRHAPDIVSNEERASIALRSGRQSSMRFAVNAVAEGEADCIVSAGNTGALMAMARFVLKMVPGIDRPAIASFFPTMRGRSVLLDLGANTDCQPENLVQFAVMGALYAKAVLGLGEPTIGLLNVGAEALKGNDVVKEAASRLRESPLPGQFRGFVEGDDIPAGSVDVVVTDGFTGNVALKTAEGTARLYTGWLKDTFRRGPLARLGYLMARGAFRQFRKRMDPRSYNGGMFVGLRGICVKSHGGMDGLGFANAIDVSIDLVRNRFNDQLVAELQAFGDDGVEAALVDIKQGSRSAQTGAT